MGEKILEAMVKVLSSMKSTESDKRISRPSGSERDLKDPFADYTPEQIDAFNAEGRELERKYANKSFYQPEPDNYTTDDFIKDIEASEG